MSDDPEPARPKSRRSSRRPRKPADRVARDFGPGAEEAPSPEGPSPAAGTPGTRIACGGEHCLLRPVAGLVSRFGVSLAGRAALGRAASSGVEMMKALRDFLDEEIAMVERAAGKDGDAPRYEKIRVE
jgi:hypothetical protein